MKLAEHPDVQRYRQRRRLRLVEPPPPLTPERLRQLCLDAGADDVGFVAIDRPELDDQRDDILGAFPATKTLISIVLHMNREAIRSPARSIANLAFHHTTDATNEVCHRIVRALDEHGVHALHPAAGFPMEADRWPGKMWVVSHKPVAVAAGMGVMGIHRNVIHPKFGNFILLGTVLMDTELSEQGKPLDYNPCLSCKLCVAACPVGAVHADGHFDFSACYTHNYREFMGGFVDWTESIAEAGSGRALRQQVSDAENVSMWQSLSFGANYKAAYCMAVCPAGEDVIGPFLDNRKGFLNETVKPLKDKAETIYVTADSDAEHHVQKRFPNKTVKRVGHGLRPHSLAGFLRGLPLVFQRNKAKVVKARYHFRFLEVAQHEGPLDATVVIDEGTLQVLDGHQGEADVSLEADGATWLRYLRREGGIVWPLLTRKVKVKGSLELLKQFETCFAT